MNIDKPSLLLYFSPSLSPSVSFSSSPFLSLSLFFQRWRVHRIREAETNRMRRRDARRDSWMVPPSLRGTSSIRYHCPRHNASPPYLSSPHPLSYSNSLYLSIFLRLDAIELLRKYISSDSRNGGKRGDTAAPSPVCLMRFSRAAVARKLQWKRENSLSSKFREYPPIPLHFFRPPRYSYLPFPSLPSLFRFQTQFVYFRDRISPLDLECLSKTRKCLTYVTFSFCVFLFF